VKRFGLSAVWFLFAATVLAGSGCQPGNQGVTVTGRLVENGSPLKDSAQGLPPGTPPIQIAFHTVPIQGQASGESFHSEVNSETGEFTTRGPSNQGIPPGKYRISVSVSVPAPAAVRPGRSGSGVAGAPNPARFMGTRDRLKGAFSPRKSPLEVEITRPSRLIIDVGAKPAVTVE
jgi:hypothetical protein